MSTHAVQLELDVPPRFKFPLALTFQLGFTTDKFLLGVDAIAQIAGVHPGVSARVGLGPVWFMFSAIYCAHD